MPPTVDPVVTAWTTAIPLLVKGRQQEAGRLITSLPLQPRPRRGIPRVEERPSLPPVKTARNVPEALKRMVWREEGYVCRYCGKRLIDLDVMRATAILLPEAFEGPYTENWPHRIRAYNSFWSHSTSVDHIWPWTRGGDVRRGNLALCCYNCNGVKGNRSLAEMGWSLRPPGHNGWDGLRRYLPALTR